MRVLIIFLRIGLCPSYSSVLRIRDSLEITADEELLTFKLAAEERSLGKVVVFENIDISLGVRHEGMNKLQCFFVSTLFIVQLH